MTSRTNGHFVGRNQGGSGEVVPADLEYRRQLAVKRYLDGDPIEQICREMGCAKSWLYKWKKRYRAAKSTWSQERSRRPKTTPSTTPAAIAAALIALRQTLSRDGSATVSARVIREHLRHHATSAIPSLRTISRMLNRQTKEVASPSTARHNSHDTLTPRPMPW